MSARSLSLATLARGLTLILLALLVVATTGRKTEPVRDLGPSTIPGHATRHQVEQAIIAAGSGLGWAMQVQAPGSIVATRTDGSHRAVVEVSYTTKVFSVRYKDSLNLKYSSADRTVHKVYNDWVTKLNNAILTQVSAIR